jgi:hypothetical protein
MIVAEAIGLAVIVLTSVGSTYWQVHFFQSRLRDQDAADEGRRNAAWKQHKAMVRDVALANKAVRTMTEQAGVVHNDTEQMHRQIDAHFAHPAVKRLVRSDRG